MNMCSELLATAKKKQNKNDMPCPMNIVPKCHPRSHFDVHVDGRRRMIYLSCAVCDKLISLIKVKGRLNSGIDPRKP